MAAQVEAIGSWRCPARSVGAGSCWPGSSPDSARSATYNASVDRTPSGQLTGSRQVTFDPNARLDASQVEDIRGSGVGRRGVAVGGGGVGLLLLLVYTLLGGGSGGTPSADDLSNLFNGGVGRRRGAGPEQHVPRDRLPDRRRCKRPPGLPDPRLRQQRAGVLEGRVRELGSRPTPRPRRSSSAARRTRAAARPRPRSGRSTARATSSSGSTSGSSMTCTRSSGPPVARRRRPT